MLFQVGIQLMEDKDNAAVRNAALRNCMFSLVSRSMTTFTLDAQAIAGLVQLVLSSEHAAVRVLLPSLALKLIAYALDTCCRVSAAFARRLQFPTVCNRGT